MRRRPALALACAAVATTAAGLAPPASANRIEEPPPRRVASAAELQDVLQSSFRGKVIVPRDAQWEMKRSCGAFDELGRCVDVPMTYLPLRRGVELVGERGPLGSRPVLYAAYGAQSYPLFLAGENDVRVEGLHLRGPRRVADRFKTLPQIRAITVVQDAQAEQGRRIVVADNEITGWTVGVDVIGTREVDYPKDFCEVPGCRLPLPANLPLVRVERNYIHDNVATSGGYGVGVGGGAYVTIEGNVFEFNNHSIAASGQAYSGYVARFNYVLRGVHTFGEDRTLPHNFDVHGRLGASRREYAGGPAGTFFDVSLNTILGSQDYGFLGRLTRAAFGLRGRPAQGARFTGNVLTHDDFDEAVRLSDGGDDSLDEDRPSTFNLRSGGNRYDTDQSTEIAAGDFDGDGRTDVFVANGTAWFFSRGGVRPWELLHPSTKRTRELGFADVDNDRRTDVLYRDGAGRVGYLKGGAGNLVALTSAPVAMKDLRFGDFDGDGLTDIFFTRAGQWRVWRGRTRGWTSAQTSTKPVSELLFGEFDGRRGTDVASVLGSGWAFSSGATAAWRRMNRRLTASFAGAIAVDLVGDGRSDVVVRDGRRWRWSRDGSSALQGLRTGAITDPPLTQLLAGRFEGGTRTTLVTFEQRLTAPGLAFPAERLAIWRGPGSGDAFRRLSAQNMR